MMRLDFRKRCYTNMLVDGLHYQVIRYGVTGKEAGEIWTTITDNFDDGSGPRRMPSSPDTSRFFFSQRIE